MNGYYHACGWICHGRMANFIKYLSPPRNRERDGEKGNPFEVSFTIDLENKVNGKIVGKSNREEITPVESIETSFKRGSWSWPWRTFNKLGNFIKFHPSSFCILCQPSNYAGRRSESQAEFCPITIQSNMQFGAPPTRPKVLL